MLFLLLHKKKMRKREFGMGDAPEARATSDVTSCMVARPAVQSAAGRAPSVVPAGATPAAAALAGNAAIGGPLPNFFFRPSRECGVSLALLGWSRSVRCACVGVVVRWSFTTLISEKTAEHPIGHREIAIDISAGWTSPLSRLSSHTTMHTSTPHTRLTSHDIFRRLSI